jgi:hypothetical protein
MLAHAKLKLKLKDKVQFRCEARWRIDGHLAEMSFRGHSWGARHEIMLASKVAMVGDIGIVAFILFSH